MDQSESNLFSPLKGETRLKLFKALESENRLKMLELLSEGEKHIIELSRLLDISAPSVAKNSKILEDVGLITRNIYGNTHVLKINEENIYSALDIFNIVKNVDMKSDKCILDVLKNLTVSEAKNIQIGEKTKSKK